MFPDMKTVFFSHILTDLVCTVFMVFLSGYCERPDWSRERNGATGPTTALIRM